MPIKIADGLAAKEKLHDEGIFTIDKGLALHQDIRPLHILILNLMPLKKPTELQLLRLLGDSPLQVKSTSAIQRRIKAPIPMRRTWMKTTVSSTTSRTAITTDSSSPAHRSNRCPSNPSTTGRK